MLQMGVGMKNKLKGSLNVDMLLMTLIPLLGLGIVLTIFSAATFKRVISSEVESGLKNLANSVVNTYDIIYPGDYEMTADAPLGLLKGDTLISGNYTIIDKVKEDTGVDITIYFQDTRILTTLTDLDGNRIVGTVASTVIFRDVFQKKSECFYDNAYMIDENYYAYYSPLYNQDGTCIGMIFAGKPAADVKKLIWRATAPTIIIALFAMLLTGFICTKYIRKIVRNIKKTEKFLASVASGKLTEVLDPEVLKRKDELGEMGRLAMKMQKSIHELIEIDVVTGIPNRRSGENTLNAIYKKTKTTGEKYTIILGAIDHFKQVNEDYGHMVGDMVLRNIAQILHRNVAGRGFVARWGGAEFLIVYMDINMKDSCEELEAVLNRIRQSSVEFNEQIIRVTMTFGVAEGDFRKELRELFKEADSKMLYGKRQGRNQIVSEAVE